MLITRYIILSYMSTDFSEFYKDILFTYFKINKQQQLDNILIELLLFKITTLFKYQTLQISRIFCDDCGAVFPEYDRIGMSESADARHINPGLDAEHHAGREHEIVVEPERRFFVLAYPDAVTGPV